MMGQKEMGKMMNSKEHARSMKQSASMMGHAKKFQNKRGDHTSKIDHQWQGKPGGASWQ